MAVFDKGDIIRVNLEPIVGRELRGDFRPVLVLSPRAFNKLGDVLVAPITQGGVSARDEGFAASLTGTGCDTQGAALINKCRMIDATACGAKLVEKAPAFVVDDACQRLIAVLEG